MPFPSAKPDIDLFIRLVKREVRKHDPDAAPSKPVRFQPFRALIACLISLRTKDEVTDEAATRLFAVADTPEKMLKLAPERIAKLIYPAGFYNVKAKTILGVCGTLVDEYGGKVPDDLEKLLELKGVGRKTANLVITKGFGKPGICVDTHVHRISNRWGYIETKTPDESEMALRQKLPRRHWLSYNGMLVSFGQTICTPVSPKCSQCPLEDLCPKAGVEKRR
jgi:endonuclease-3